MSKQIIASLLVLFSFIIFFSSCISFNLDSLKDKKAKGIVFQPPPEPYQKVEKEEMDMAWENPENNSTLSFFSNCSRVTRFVPLKQFQKELLDGLKTFQVRSQKETEHQDQKAVYLLLSESGSGSQIMSMEIFLFKKEKCFYVLSFLKPLLKEYNIDQVSVFENFVKGFHAP